MIDLDWEKLERYIDIHNDTIECVFCGIKEYWEDTSDEVWCSEFGWIQNDAHTMISEGSGTPIAYIHYKTDFWGPNFMGTVKVRR